MPAKQGIVFSLSCVRPSVQSKTEQVSQLWQRDRTTQNFIPTFVESAILRRWITLRLNFRLKAYVSCQYLWTVRWGNGYNTTLPLEVFTQSNFIAHFEDLGVMYALHL